VLKSKSVKGFSIYRGPKIGYSPLTWLVALTTVRHYRADCDFPRYRSYKNFRQQKRHSRSFKVIGVGAIW